MTVLKYKDFQGSVSFEDGTLVAQILHIDDLIVAECDYLETCGAAPRPIAVTASSPTIA
jgi:hypothetical protein